MLIAVAVFVIQIAVNEGNFSVREWVLFLSISVMFILLAFFPKTSAVGLAILYLSLIPFDLRAGLLILLAPVSVGILAFWNKLFWALVLVISALIAGLYSVAEQKFSFEPISLLIALIMFVLPLFGGLWVGKLARTHQLAVSTAREQREELSMALHDDIATDLSSVVVRLEVLAMKHEELAPKLSVDLWESVQSIRGTLLSLRVLIENLTLSLENNRQVNRLGLAQYILIKAKFLRKHGFDVQCRIDNSVKVQLTQNSASLESALNEAFANVIKHGNLDEKVEISVESIAEKKLITNENYYISGESRGGSNLLGLDGMQKALIADSGELRIVDDGSRWTLSILVSPSLITSPVSN
ncbi:hypothetical protein J433_01105 [Corynebacterium glutamicum MT]|uniref:Signal transduction histidine kinase subgroup 3 dimerisation and phosphoacceptor domain-containing protein n=1 Tax=Corynebacterium glutamicum TaxID=1718 RepID=A0AB36IAY0_CORGT|nr:histidine kinase [Corynebacterium glutamicum]AGN20830.1 hypothetical protein C629_01090 [Corynebacterium glutamicum SCgG2]AGN17807.1 hypothetical protein C624_01090 [Corynebacterium glutamicum SCgG1]EGV39893.1 hypothetical protein CgS9114_10612 [Corynebacterium glutamicum S9114]EOA66046.1 hypothetical protein J433_01105 [Corynebacterium glutamicum MT]EPP42113.1 hypothetical protein A583_00625 [Corynebacterium glutamicum Z188]